MLPARMLTCTDGRISTGMASVLSRAVRMATKSLFADAVVDMDVLRALLADRRLPGIGVPARRLVVVAHPQRRFARQGKNTPDRAIERARIAAGKIGARGAVVGHEQRVADKDIVADLVADAGRRVARRVHHFDRQPADLQASRRPSEAGRIGAPSPVTSVALKIGAKTFCTSRDMFADRDLGRRLRACR